VVEDLVRLDGSVEDVRQQFLDVGLDRCRTAGEGDVAAEQPTEPDRRLLVTAADRPG
jgi:hypothetical protein